MIRRGGLTLLEVITALTIFLLSMTGVWTLVTMGSERALDVQQQGRASLLCQSKMAEVMAGIEPLGSSGGYAPLPVDLEEEWQWRMDAGEGEVPGVWQVVVFVRHERPGGRVIEASLGRLLLDPAMRGSTFDTPEMTPSAPSGDPSADPNAANAASTPSSSADPSGSRAGGSNAPSGKSTGGGRGPSGASGNGTGGGGRGPGAGNGGRPSTSGGSTSGGSTPGASGGGSTRGGKS